MKPLPTTVFLALLVTSVSCRKDKIIIPEEAPKSAYAGTYDCTVHHHYSDLTGVSSDTTEQKNLTLPFVDDSVQIFGARLHEDDIVFGETYFFGYSYHHMNVRFEQDSIFIYTFNGGLGGGNSVRFKGRKLD